MENLLKQLRDNWVILGFLVMVIMTWTTFNTRLSAAESKISELQEVLNSINSMQTDIAVMKNDITYIKTNIK